MATIHSTFEYDGVLGLNAGETATVGWEMFDGDFPPLVDHSVILRGSESRHFVQVRGSTRKVRRRASGERSTTPLENLDSAFIYTGLNNIWLQRSTIGAAREDTSDP